MKIESYAQGMTCWTDLGSTDQEASKAFYSKLFGWTYQDFPMDESGELTYSMAVKDGSFVAGIYTQAPDQKEAGIPPHWDVHIAVDNVDEVAARVESCGGSVLFGPFDVFDLGRTAVISDPSGGAVFLWQGKDHMGAGVQNEHGAMGWCELLSTDPKAAIQFFTSLLGVESETAVMSDGNEYTVYLRDGIPLAGTMAFPEAIRGMGIPSHWSVYFHVDDVDASFAKATSLGAVVHLAPMDIADVGRIAFVGEPQGVGFGLITPAGDWSTAG